MTIVVFGAKGQLGRCLQDEADARAIRLTSFDRLNGDISQKNRLETIFASISPSIIINCAAYTAVDKAEVETTQAFAANTTGPKHLAELAHRLQIPLIHISTDYVFDGASTVAYRPQDNTNPNTVYGTTKLQGEQAIRDQLKEHLIVRCSWLFSEYSNNFVKTMLRLGKTRSEISVVSDQQGCPTYAGDIAKALLDMVNQISLGAENWGTYHYCGATATNWFQFARTIFKLQSAMTGDEKPVINAIPTDAYPTKARRPKYSVLDCSQTWSTWNLEPPSWELALARTLKKLHAEKIELA